MQISWVELCDPLTKVDAGLQMAENLFIIWLLDQMWSWNKKLTVARGRDIVGQDSDGFTIGWVSSAASFT